MGSEMCIRDSPCSSRALERPLQVYAENTIPVLIRHIVEVLKIYEASRPGVVDEDVQLAKRLDGLRDNSPAICISSHVSLHPHRANAICLALLGHLLGPVCRATAVDRHVAAALGQLQPRCRTDAPASSRDEGHFSVQVHGRNLR